MTNMFSITLIFLILLSNLCFSIADTGCQNSYPIKNTLDIVKKIIEKHAVEKSMKRDGFEWLNLLISNDNTVEVDGVEYYLNSNELNPENTYYLDIHRFYHIPVYVASSKEIREWVSSAPDKTKLLSKIGRRCSSRDDVLCGLECCPRRVQTIQKILAASSNQQIVFRNVTYKTINNFESRNEKNTKVCRFDLNKDDVLKTSSIFYQCKNDENCCTLSCYKTILNAPSAIIWQKSNLAVQFHKYKFLFLSIILFSTFVIITVYNQKLMKRHQSTNSPPNSNIGTIRSEKSTDSDKSQKTVTTVIFEEDREEDPESTPILLSKSREDNVSDLIICI